VAPECVSRKRDAMLRRFLEALGWTSGDGRKDARSKPHQSETSIPTARKSFGIRNPRKVAPAEKPSGPDKRKHKK
jgi:hypothetical protein